MTHMRLGADAAAAGPTTIDWQRMLAEHQRWLRTVVFARVREAQAVDEVLQEVALAAVAQKQPLRDVTKVAPWLYRLAIRQCLMYRRKCGRARKLIGRYAERGGSEADIQQTDPLGWLLADERRQLVRQALLEMNGRDAEMLLLKYTEEWSYQQLANRLGISQSAVEARLHRARARLRTLLASSSVIEITR